VTRHIGRNNRTTIPRETQRYDALHRTILETELGGVKYK
jgi:hypothetical protein